MGRSWRSFFRRSKQTEETPDAVVEAPEFGAVEGPGPPEDVSAEPVLTVSAEAEEAMVAAPEVETAVDETAVEEPPVVVEPVALREASAGAASSENPAVTDETVEEEPGGWFGRLREGLRRSRESFVGQLNAAVAEFRDAEDEEFWERVEEILITSDVGVPTTAKLVAELEQEALERNITSAGDLRQLMIEHATRLLEKPVELDISHKPTVVLMVGVNGTGKTTNIGKLVHFLPGKVMLAAGDTFRAAAIEQLQMWGERTGARVISSERGADSASVAHEAVEEAKRDGTNVLLIDTAGRLHTKVNLMGELDKGRRG